MNSCFGLVRVHQHTTHPHDFVRTCAHAHSLLTVEGSHGQPRRPLPGEWVSQKIIYPAVYSSSEPEGCFKPQPHPIWELWLGLYNSLGNAFASGVKGGVDDRL